VPGKVVQRKTKSGRGRYDLEETAFFEKVVCTEWLVTLDDLANGAFQRIRPKWP
jgi:hypothetical protein